MKDGNFRLSADAIVLIKGALANGQHRLWAVIEADEPQPFLLMETDDDELYKVLDCGLKRTVADAAHVNNGNSISAIAKLVVSYAANTLTQHGYTKKCTRLELIEHIQAHNTKLQDAYNFVKALSSRTQNLSPLSAPSALVVISSHWHRDRAKEFLEAVYHGSSPGTICHDLRERCIKMRMTKGNIAAQYYLALFIKAFNAFHSDTKLGVLKMLENENYPQVTKPK